MKELSVLKVILLYRIEQKKILIIDDGKKLQ